MGCCHVQEKEPYVCMQERSPARTRCGAYKVWLSERVMLTPAGTKNSTTGYQAADALFRMLGSTPVFSPPSDQALDTWLRSTSPPAQPFAFVMLHTEHEGSHAMAEQVNRFNCTAVLTQEQLDPHRQPADHSEGGVNSTLLEALQAIFNGGADAVAQTLQRMGRCRTAECIAEFKDLNREGVSKGVLLRDRSKGVLLVQLHKELQAAGKPGLKPLFLVRSDLLRWSLSRYDSKWSSTKAPEGAGVSQSSRMSLPVERRTYDLEHLARIAEKGIQSWKERVSVVRYLRQHGLSPEVLLYEDFLATSPDAWSAAILEKVNADPCEPHEKRTARVRRVRQGNIRDFAANAEAVEALFAKYPSLASLFHEGLTTNRAKPNAITITSATLTAERKSLLERLGFNVLRILPVYTDRNCVQHRVRLIEGAAFLSPTGSYFRLLSIPMGESRQVTGIFAAHVQALRVASRSAGPSMIMESDWSISEDEAEQANSSFASRAAQLDEIVQSVHADGPYDLVSVGFCRYGRKASVINLAHPLCLTAFIVHPKVAGYLAEVLSACKWKIPIDWFPALLCNQKKLRCRVHYERTRSGTFGQGMFQQHRAKYGGVHAGGGWPKSVAGRAGRVTAGP